MYILKLKHHFDAAHKLENYDGPCANLHGHRWEVEIAIQSEELMNGMVIDFKKVKKVIDKYDHTYLNDNIKAPLNPTAETIAEIIWNDLYKVLKKEYQEDFGGFKGNLQVTIWESPEASITYMEDK
jgi:6-pyruvoyltetrahydropterin/6-carboxytetrahydropterin synthase